MADRDFTVLIDCKNHLTTKDIDNRSYDYDNENDNDNITSVSYDLATSFYDRGIVFFLKLENSVYPTHIVELSIFIESIYDLFKFITDRDIKTYELDFYEQGIEYLFSFEKVDSDFYCLKFIDRGIEDFKQIIVQSSLLDLHLMLFTFYSRITFLTRTICPSIDQSDIYKKWRSIVDPILS